MGGWRRAGAVMLVSLLASGCIGATDRSDFDAEVRRRGGGITDEWIAEAVGLVAVAVAAPSGSELEIMSMSVTPSNRSLTATARRGDRPDFVDTVSVREGEVVGVTPMQDADQLPLDDIVLRVGDLPLDDIESLSDRALAEFGEADGFVQGVSVTISASQPVVTVKVASARRTASVLFDGNGEFVEVAR